MIRTMSALGVLALLWPFTPAHAQDRAAMLQTSASGARASQVGHAFDRLARSRLEALAPMAIDAAPPLPLEDLQLAVGCVGESRQCLEAVAERLEVQVMVVPSIEASGDELVASFLRIDVGEGAPRRIVRRAESEGELLDQVEPMLRELFGLPPLSVEDDDGAEPRRGRSDGRREPVDGEGLESGASETRGFPVGPAIVAGTGLVAIVGGAIFGALAKGSEADYLATDTTSRAGVDAAQSRLDEAQTNALVANVLFGVGAAAIVGAAIWWLVGADSPFGVSASEDGVALSFEGRWGGGS